MKRKRLASVLGASALMFGTMLAPAMPVFAATSYTIAMISIVCVAGVAILLILKKRRKTK